MKEKSAAESAVQEAWEEGGIESRVSSALLGQYSYSKSEFEANHAADVLAFSLEVTRLSKNYPERGQRDHLWTATETAADLVEEKTLTTIIHALVDHRTLSSAGKSLVSVSKHKNRS